MFFVCSSYVPRYMIVMINGAKVNSVEVSFQRRRRPIVTLKYPYCLVWLAHGYRTLEPIRQSLNPSRVLAYTQGCSCGEVVWKSSALVCPSTKLPLFYLSPTVLETTIESYNLTCIFIILHMFHKIWVCTMLEIFEMTIFLADVSRMKQYYLYLNILP